jgi:hypothetical protein
MGSNSQLINFFKPNYLDSSGKVKGGNRNWIPLLVEWINKMKMFLEIERHGSLLDICGKSYLFSKSVVR